MAPTLTALLPVFLMIAAGYGLRRWQRIPAAFWQGAERLAYYIFFPALLITHVSSAQLAGLSVLPMLAALACGVLITALLAVWGRGRLGLGGAAFTSFFQGAVRPNSYVGFAAAGALFGDAGITLVAICLAAIVPLVNALSVAALVRHGDGAESGVGGVLLALVRNPLILASLLGIALNLTGIGLPPLVTPLLELAAGPALPLSLLCVGAGLDVTAARHRAGIVWRATVLRLLAAPAITALALSVFGVEGLTATVATLYAGLPTAATAYVLARNLGGDAETMAGTITASTLAAVVTLPLVLMLA